MQHKLEEELAQAALSVRQNAYAPYSKFRVGAAIRTADGNILTGCNFENASYGLSICAEQSAVAAMIASGRREITMVAVASTGAVSPCGACRQILAEFGLNFTLVLVDSESQLVQQRWSMNDLLPAAFKLL